MSERSARRKPLKISILWNCTVVRVLLSRFRNEFVDAALHGVQPHKELSPTVSGANLEAEPSEDKLGRIRCEGFSKIGTTTTARKRWDIDNRGGEWYFK